MTPWKLHSIWGLDGYCMRSGEDELHSWKFLRFFGPATRDDVHEYVAGLPRTKTWSRLRVRWIRAATAEEVEDSR